MNDLYELLSDKQKKEVAEAAKAKIIEGINNVHAAYLTERIKPLIVEDVQNALAANYLSDTIDWQGVGDVFTQVIKDAVTGMLREWKEGQI